MPLFFRELVHVTSVIKFNCRDLFTVLPYCHFNVCRDYSDIPYFILVFLYVEWLLSKSFVFLSGSPFPGPLARERIMLVVGFFVCLFVCVLGCGVFCFGVCVVCILLVFPACCLLQFKVWDI